MSRQREWQIRMRSEERCQICGKPQTVPGYCQRHHDKRLEAHRARDTAGPKKHCGYCGVEGHNRRGCPNLLKPSKAREGTT